MTPSLTVGLLPRTQIELDFTHEAQCTESYGGRQAVIAQAGDHDRRWVVHRSDYANDPRSEAKQPSSIRSENLFLSALGTTVILSASLTRHLFPHRAPPA